MFSYPGPPRPAIPEEPASAHLTSDQRSAQPPTPPTHAHGRTVQCEVFSGGGGGSVATGGSGHGDRVAPPEPVTPQDNCGAAPSSFRDRTSRRLVRPRPEIPDHLYRRWAALLPSDAGINYKHKPQQEGVGGHGGVGPSGGPVAGPADEGARTLTSPDLSPASGGPPESPDYSVDFSSSSAARFRLGNSTGVLGGGRKEGGRGPPPSRPPRSRQDHLESLRKCTERLKTPSPDKKARADSAPPPDTSSAGKGPESAPPRAKTKGRNNEPRSVVTRHPSLGKSPSLPPQLPSAKDLGDNKPSSPPTLKDQKDVGPQGGAREDEDVFKEDIAKLPPRPRPEPRLGISPRVIPFRSASVSQVDVSSDGPFSSRSSKSPTAIRLYPICTNYYFSNTLPRRKPVVADKEEGRTQDGPELHPPLAAAVSISDMTNVGAKTGSSQPEKLENKSKSESELSAAGLRAGEGGSPKVDILVKDLRDNNNARGKKADFKEEPDGEGKSDKPKHLNVNEIELKRDQKGGNDSKQMASENTKVEMPSHSDKDQGVNKADLEKNTTGSDAKTVQNVIENDSKTDLTKINNEQNLFDGGKNTSACVVDHKDFNVGDIANSKISIEISSETPQKVEINSKSSENVDKERALGNDTQRGSEGDPGGLGLVTSATSLPSHGDVAQTKGSGEGGNSVNNVAGIRTSVGEIPSLQGNVDGPSTSKKDSTTEAPHVSEEGAAVEGSSSAGDVTSSEFVVESGIEGHNDEVSVADRGDVSVLGKDGECEVSGAPPGGEPPNSGGLVPPEDTLKSVHDPQEHKELSNVDPSALSNKISLVHNECPTPKSDIRLAEIPSEEPSSAPRAAAASVGEAKAPHAEGSGSQCTDRRQIECQVLQKEPRLSQCLVIKTGAREGEGDPLGVQGATSECRVMRSRPRLPREDSDGDSGEREPSRATYVTQVSDEGIFEEEIKSQEPRDSSDSSSQDSVGVSQERCEEAVEAAAASATEAPVRTGSRRRRKLTEEGSERSLTFPPPRKGSQADSIGYSSVESNGLRSLATSGGYGDRGSSEEQRSSVSLADSFQSEASQPRDAHQLLIISETRPIDRAERKKKHHSDPSCERRGSTDALLYLSDPHLGNTTSEGEATRTSSKGVVSQASTDSEGRDERGEQPIVGVPRLTPQVMFSGHESDGSDYPPCRTPARNASPIPYLQDSDSGDRSAPRSPLGPRRYSKRPLRGPYGEMLEAEMSKSKSSSTYLTEDSYLRLREAKSCSPRPPSPASPAVMVEGTGRPSLIIPTTRSFDDSAISINYSNTSDRPLRRKISEETDPGATSPVGGTAWESDGEGTLSPPLSIGPIHQRTASSPCKLFSEGGFTSEEEQELVDYYSAATRLLAQQNQHQRSQQHRQQQQQQLQPELTQQEHLGSELASEPRHPGTHEHRHTPDHRHSHKRHRDTRAHVVGELYDTEKNYVSDLSFLLTKYMQTLKNPEFSNIIDGNLVDDIFFQVPEIHALHERFLEELKQRIESRDANMCVGDLFLQLVNDPSLIESYTAFTNNWKTAHEAAKAAAQAKQSFKHFLLARAREHHGKLDLKALLIKPVQRFPQFELLMKRLLKHTSRDHPDHALLTEAIVMVLQIASRINASEQEALQLEQQQLLLKELENTIEGLDGLVQPDRTYLRHDLVTMHSGLGTRKERCLFLFSDLLVIAATKRRSGTIRKGSSLQFTVLSSLEANKFKLFKFIPLDDLEIARSRDESVKKLVREKETLEEDLQTLQQISKLTKNLRCPHVTIEESVQETLATVQKQLAERHGADSQPMELELTISTQEGMENLVFLFNSVEKRAMWEEAFNDAKHKLAMSADRRPPPEFVSALPIRKTRAGLQFTCAAATLGLNAHNLRDVWVCNSDGYVGQVCVLSLQPDPTVACCNGVCNARILSIASIPAAPHPESSDDDEDEESPTEDALRTRRSESLPPEMGSDDSDNQQPTMWLGTEDGFIHVYNCSDTIRIKKNKFKFQPGSPVHCIIHLDTRVFASLANGDIIVYRRDVSGGWNVADRQVVSISTAAAPVTKMMAVAGKLWCAAMNTVRVLNTGSLQVEHSFVVGGENGRGVSCMVSAGHGVWISVLNSAAVRLYHAVTYEYLREVNVAQAVTKMLAGCDDIIRQHKAACLRVTSLLACKDLLWVGTSAGVIITVPLPHLALNTNRVQAPLNMVGIPYGHTGHVRFLTSVELTPEPRTSRLKGHHRYSFKGKDHPHHQPGTAAPAKLLVISGGDGYEDFRNSGMSELAGRDDSTNHLLLWQV